MEFILNLVLIEDDKYLADNLVFLLQSHNHEVTWFQRVRILMEQFDHLKNAEVVILDLIMRRGKEIQDIKPGYETGEYLYEKIRETYPSKIVVVLTAKDESEIESTLLKTEKASGVTHFVKKPISSDIRELIKTLESI